MMGTLCRNAGLWATDASLRNVNRIDGNQIATAASFPAVSPDGSKVAFTWNSQLWMTTLGRTDLVQLTSLPNAVQAGAWSPDGRAVAVLTLNVSMPVQSVILLRPEDHESTTTKNLTVTPFAPLSWR
jgi:Tol biopolymer transport system component